MQQLALYVMKTTLKQCENLSDDILMNKLQISEVELDQLIKTLHDEHVLRKKYTFACPFCRELNTVKEGGIGDYTCQFCDEPIDIMEHLNGAGIRYVLDRSDFFEYMEENYKNELIAAKNGEKPNSRLIPFSSKNGVTNDGEENEDMVKEKKLFISHCTKDYKYVKAFVEFLEDIGMPDNSIFCSSIDGYNIPWGEDIYEHLANEFNEQTQELMIVFMLSDNYYNSAACLNEMGATWILKKDYRSILLPGFEYKQIDGAINAGKIAIKLDDANISTRLNDIKNQMAEIFGFTAPVDNKWDRIRNDFLEKVK